MDVDDTEDAAGVAESRSEARMILNGDVDERDDVSVAVVVADVDVDADGCCNELDGRHNGGSGIR